MRDNRIVIAGIVIVLLIIGVFIVFLGGGDNAGETSVVSVPEVNTGVETSVVVQETMPEVTTEATATNQSESVVPTPRTDLEATDPSSVNLLSGNVQFVEAFAFW